MKLKDILKKVGAGVIKDAVPGGGVLVSVLSDLLPAGKKPPAGITGADLAHVIDTLPAKEKAALYGKEFDVEITEIKESNETVRAMLHADATSSHTTRPYIAVHSFHVVAGVVVVTVAMWAYAIFKGDAALVLAVTGGWPFILGAIAPFTILLQAYFGVLRKEHQNKLDAGNGSPTSSALSGLISAFVKR